MKLLFETVAHQRAASSSVLGAWLCLVLLSSAYAQQTVPADQAERTGAVNRNSHL